MVSYHPSSERQGNVKAALGNGHGHAHAHGRPEKTSGTPRKDVRVVKEKAVQVPELRDYVCGSLPEGAYLLLLIHC